MKSTTGINRYVKQLLGDIRYATDNVSLPFIGGGPFELDEWQSDEEEDKTAPVRMLNEWSGIHSHMLPPEHMLSNAQVTRLLKALNQLLDAYNCAFVLQTEVPERIQYETIRQNFNQQVKVKRWHMGFFAMCEAGTERRKCVLGEHCQCLFYDELLSRFSDDDDRSGDRSPDDSYDDDEWKSRYDFFWDDDDEW